MFSNALLNVLLSVCCQVTDLGFGLLESDLNRCQSADNSGDQSPTCHNSVLKVEGLGRQIHDRWIWQEVSFELAAGDRLAVIGPSGTGKSLLLRALTGLDTPQAGRIYFNDRLLSDWSMPDYRAQVIYLQQRPALFEGTVEENLQSVYRFGVHRQKSYDRDRIVDYLKALNRSAQLLDRSSSTLSGGEAQIVAFLRALQLAPQLFLFDEPTTALDGEAVQQFEALVQLWQTEAPQRAYLWTSHNLEQVQRVSDRQFNLAT